MVVERYRFVISFLFVLLCVLTCPTTHGVQRRLPVPLLKPGYYMVVAAYRPGRYDYVQQYVHDLATRGVKTAVGLDPQRNYLYVYLESYTDRARAIAGMYRVRRAGVFNEAWIRVIGGDGIADEDILALPATSRGVKHPSAAPVEAVVSDPMEPVPSFDSAEVSIGKKQVDVLDSAVVLPPDTVLVRLCQRESNTVVEGDVLAFDTDRSTLLGVLQAGVSTPLPDPANNSGMLTLEVSVFGYKPQRVYLPYRVATASDTSASFSITRDGTGYLLVFYLERYARGELYTMDHVYFYNNAAIMLPGSSKQLVKLLEMMRVNPAYRIRLHGHTNGKVAGKLITAGPTNDFFTLSSDVREGFGSARRLSLERALTIKKWLMKHGIDADRIKTKAWGGAKMIYAQNRSTAYRNVRVEVEILDQ